MKNILLPALAVALMFASASVNAQTLPPGWPFPDKTDERTRDKEERRRERDERVIVDRDGKVINRDGSSRNDRNLPPGQAKKKYGSKSARVYAPGQRKKAERDDDGIFGSRRDRNDRRETDIFGTRRDRDDDDDDDDNKRKKQKKYKKKGKK